MSVFAARGAADREIGGEELRQLVLEAVAQAHPDPKRLLLLPPDHTRLNSRAGEIVNIIHAAYRDRCRIDIMPALGTHAAMGEAELDRMFGRAIPRSCFKVHDWRNGVKRLGAVPGSLLRQWSDGKVDYDVAVEVNRILFDGYDLILSIGQVVPHEVAGMANYTKNLMVGVGGADIINKSHFLGAVSNMEKIMGRTDTPVRRLFNYGAQTFLGGLPVAYLLTVVGRDGRALKGFYAGTGDAVFEAAARLSVETNLALLDRPLAKVVVWLDPEEFRSTWLGNKAIYRTRMAIADGGELVILAPGLKEFGEDPEIDRLIRRYGYRGTEQTLAGVAANADLRANLGAAAHLIHGSSEGRFAVTYCPGPGMSRGEIEGAGFRYRELAAYDTAGWREGFNRVGGEDVFFIGNPALGLWALKSAFKEA